MSLNREPAQPIARLLLAWQSTGDERKLEELFGAIATLAEPVARHVLLAAGITDPGAIDDAMSKMFDHLRRLPGPREGERGVAVFRPKSCDDSSPQHESDGRGPRRGDAGVAFVRWLAKRRANDIARAVLRRARRTRLFSQLQPEDAGIVRSIEARDSPASDPLGDDVRLAIESLDGRSRLVVELLLEGESQAAIARRMGVCEGTVSRIRAGAIENLRSAIGFSPTAGKLRRWPK